MPLTACIKQTTFGDVSFSDHKTSCKLIIENINKIEFIKVQVDNCLPITGTKCDFALLIKSCSACILIELKGSNFKHAVDQLDNTIKWFLSVGCIKSTNCYIVMSNRIPGHTAKIQNIIDRFRKKNGIIIKTVRSGNRISL